MTGTPHTPPSRTAARRALAYTAVVAVLIAGALTSTTDTGVSHPRVLGLPGATAEPTGPGGPTGPGPGNGTGGGSQFQPPGLPQGGPGYSGGNYPAPPQGNGIDINNPSAAPEYSQAPQYPQQSYPQRQPPVHGTQPPDYDAPTQSAPEQARQQAESSQRQPEQQQEQEQSDQEHDQPNEDREQPQDQQDSRECDGSAQSISAIRDGRITYRSTSQYAQALSLAASSWNRLGYAPISRAHPGEAPTLEIKDVDKQTANWRAEYERAQGGRPAQISINTAFLKDASPQLIQSLIAHELGHALGLLDSRAAGSLMNSLAAGPDPTALDSEALSRVTPPGAACVGEDQTPRTYDCLFGGQNADGSCSALNDLRGEDQYGRKLEPYPGPEWIYENDSNPEIAEPTDTMECEAKSRDPRCGGIVRVCYPKDLPSIPDDMAKERAIYIDGSNLFVQDNGGVVVRRTTQGIKDLEAQRRKDVAAARSGNEALFRGKDAGHVPDIVWKGANTIDARMVFPMTRALNRSIGGQAAAYPIGYEATAFVPGRWVNDACVPE